MKKPILFEPAQFTCSICATRFSSHCRHKTRHHFCEKCRPLKPRFYAELKRKKEDR